MLYGLRSMNDGLHYTIQNRNLIEKFSYKTGEAVETLFDAGNFSKVENYSGYSFSDAENKILIETGQEPFRSGGEAGDL